jgi:hypothetical protein
MGELRIMGPEGDIKTVWDPDKKTEVAEARLTFERMKRRGYLAYEVKKRGEKGEVIHEFDPDAGKIILAPPMAGG